MSDTIHYVNWATSGLAVQEFAGFFAVSAPERGAVGAFENPIGTLLPRFTENGDMVYSAIPSVTAFLRDERKHKLVAVQDNSWLAKDENGDCFLVEKPAAHV